MAQLYISLQKSSFNPGDTIQGQVFVKINSNIRKCEGISLSLRGFESIKWIQTKKIAQPNNITIVTNNSKNQSLPSHFFNAQIKDILSFQQHNKLRPKSIRTAKGQYYQIEYHEASTIISESKVYLSEQTNISSAVYCYPFVIKTYQQWPNSFNYQGDNLSAQIRYELISAIEPENPKFQFKSRRQIICQSKSKNSSFQYQHSNPNFLCFSKGLTSYQLSYQEPFIFGQKSQITVDVDNRNSSNNATLTYSLLNLLDLRQQNGEQIRKIETQLNKENSLNIQKGASFIENKSIKCNIFEDSKILKIPSTVGKLINSTNYLLLDFHYSNCFSSKNGQKKDIELGLKESGDDQFLVELKKGGNVKQMKQSVMNVKSNWKNTNLHDMISLQKLKGL